MRKPAAILTASLLAMLCLVAVATGAIPPSYVSASVFPRHKLHAPYTFTTSGTVHYRRCPHGTTKHNYCTDIPPGHACTGSVSLAVRIDSDPLLADANTTVIHASGKLAKNCTYAITTTIPTADLTATSRYHRHQKGAYVYLSFGARFDGNSILSAHDARTQNVIARLTQP